MNLKDIICANINKHCQIFSRKESWAIKNFFASKDFHPIVEKIVTDTIDSITKNNCNDSAHPLSAEWITTYIKSLK